MADIIRLTRGHPLVGTWQSADHDDFGTGVQFRISADGDQFRVTGVDTHDGEALEVSDVRWDGHVLRFNSLVPSNGHRVGYSFEPIGPNEVRVHYTVAERWTRADES